MQLGAALVAAARASGCLLAERRRRAVKSNCGLPVELPPPEAFGGSIFQSELDRVARVIKRTAKRRLEPRRADQRRPADTIRVGLREAPALGTRRRANTRTAKLDVPRRVAGNFGRRPAELPARRNPSRGAQFATPTTIPEPSLCVPFPTQRAALSRRTKRTRQRQRLQWKRHELNWPPPPPPRFRSDLSRPRLFSIFSLSFAHSKTNQQ